jgi:ABC-type phosphate transport system substrate-binding protein
MRLFLLSLLFLWVILPELLQAEEMMAVITSASFPFNEVLDKEDLDRIYRRKKLYWGDGEKIIPVNLPVTHPLRRSFSRLVLGALPAELEAYWNEQYFHGVSPPYVLASEEAVVQFIATTPGSIGYVNAASVHGRVRVLIYLPTALAK